ncbi:MAG: M3 family metallopeptidase [Acidobacteria bacterium]|nr:M3 family metallopeptidase [Acidobacteriota bacterium]
MLEIQFRIPFDRIQAGHAEPAVDALIADAGERLEALAAMPGPRTFGNTMLACDRLTERLESALSVVRHLESVATTPELRAAHNAIQPKAAAFFSNIPLHAGLWKAIKSYAETAEARALRGPRRRFLDRTMETFRRHGADLDPAGKRRLEEIEVELTTITTRFSENVLDSTNAFELVIAGREKLAGLPETALAAARQSAASKGLEGWRFTLQAPSFVPLMTYLDDAGLRERVYRAYFARASSGEHDNRPLIGRILELRAEKARLVGYADFADFALADRMAQTGDRAQKFVDDLCARTEAAFLRENEELAAFRRSIEGPAAPPPRPWDVAYYSEKQRQARYDFDEEALRPYFPLPRVMEGLFAIYSRVFGIRVLEVPGVPVWDPAVRHFEIRDAATAELLGGFYADFYPRENKRGGAWMDFLITGGAGPRGQEPHLGLICGNLTPPVAGRPALLTHDEVQTIFHEFGHLLHHCLSRTELRSQSGTAVVWDFIELPSQILENWCWEREALDLVASHYETGEPLPEDLVAKMKRARTYRAANGQMRQLGFSVADLALHRRYSPATDGDPVAYTRAILQRFSPAPLEADHFMMASFTHLFSDPVAYAAGYYSYKWAEVLDADAFTRFRQEGIFSERAGREFRDAILATGDSEDPGALFRRFMGRDPDPRALLERCGLVSGEAA